MVALVALALSFPARPAPAPLLQSAQALHCRIEVAAGAKGKDCHVTVPAGRQVRACTDPDRSANRCDPSGAGKYVAWVVGTGPGRCRISKKKSKWDRGIVYAKLSKSEGASSTCDLYVEVR